MQARLFQGIYIHNTYLRISHQNLLYEYVHEKRDEKLLSIYVTRSLYVAM